MQSVKISVIIPAFNEEKLIGKCLKAVKNQTISKDKYEILVIDNNSTDKTAEVAKKLGARVITYKNRQGFVAAKQFGAKKARGEIIAYTDADSIPSKYWLENIEKIMQNEKIVYIGGTILSTEKGLADHLLKFYDSFARLNYKFGVPLIWSPNMAVRKSAFAQVKGFNTSLKTSDDWDFTMRIQKEFGKKSTLYTNELRVKTSPRKLKKFDTIMPYVFIGLINYISIFTLRQSKTFGYPVDIR